MMVAENYILYTIVISTGRQTGVVIPYRVRTVHRDPTGPDATGPYHLWAYTKRRSVLL